MSHSMGLPTEISRVQTPCSSAGLKVPVYSRLIAGIVRNREGRDAEVIIKEERLTEF